MVLSKRVARFNKVATNRVLGKAAPRLPGLAMVVHQGRTSGRRYETPVNVFGGPDNYVIALTYGPDADWVRNVLAAGGCEIVSKGETIRLTDPRVVHDEARTDMPKRARFLLARFGVSDFLHLRRAD
ncbi:nitroreductase family deazaflavin-dependent oxidoreductase [Actinopolymorpha sp. NPDC004070]|uniref:nitroreductase family deazaflavin-dependent oxidoreductase n=1 Tax=Actinopolymorpha sp. NPDC004070 TaxID=3154548 RepID=UPI0033BF1DD2